MKRRDFTLTDSEVLTVLILFVLILALGALGYAMKHRVEQAANRTCEKVGGELIAGYCVGPATIQNARNASTR